MYRLIGMPQKVYSRIIYKYVMLEENMILTTFSIDVNQAVTIMKR